MATSGSFVGLRRFALGCGLCPRDVTQNVTHAVRSRKLALRGFSEQLMNEVARGKAPRVGHQGRKRFGARRTGLRCLDLIYSQSSSCGAVAIGDGGTRGPPNRAAIYLGVFDRARGDRTGTCRPADPVPPRPLKACLFKWSQNRIEGAAVGGRSWRRALRSSRRFLDYFSL